jgi:hypothetical protein
MAIVKKVILANAIKNGTVVTGVDPLGNSNTINPYSGNITTTYTSMSKGYGIGTDGQTHFQWLNVHSSGALQSLYNTRFDNPRYYAGDTNA